VAAAGAVVLGSSVSVGGAAASVAQPADIDQIQAQGIRSANGFRGCGDLAGIFARANIDCPLNDVDGSSDGDDDLGLDGISALGGTFNGPVNASGDAVALVNIAKSYGDDSSPRGEWSSCNSCNADYYDDYGSEDAKPYKSKPYKAKKAKKAKKHKAHKSHKAHKAHKSHKAHKAHKAKAHKAHKVKKHKAHKAKARGKGRTSPRRGSAWYAAPGTLPSTRRLTRPAPEAAVRVAAQPEAAAAVEPQAAERGLRAFLTKLVKPGDHRAAS